MMAFSLHFTSIPLLFMRFDGNQGAMDVDDVAFAILGP